MRVVPRPAFYPGRWGISEADRVNLYDGITVSSLTEAHKSLVAQTPEIRRAVDHTDAYESEVGILPGDAVEQLISWLLNRLEDEQAVSSDPHSVRLNGRTYVAYRGESVEDVVARTKDFYSDDATSEIWAAYGAVSSARSTTE